MNYTIIKRRSIHNIYSDPSFYPPPIEIDRWYNSFFLTIKTYKDKTYKDIFLGGIK